METMNKTDLQIYLDVCKNNDWNIYDYGNQIELAQPSPLCDEDFSFVVEKENFVHNVCEYAAEFDEEEHARFWIAQMGKDSSVPQSICRLVDDAREIKNILEDLADALRATESRLRFGEANR